MYDLDLLRSRHSELIKIDLTPHLQGAARSSSLPLPGAIENLYLFCQPDTYEVAFSLLRPENLRDAWRVGRWVWETPVFPRDWLFAQKLLHEVWTPSQFCANTFQPYLNIPVKVVRHAVTKPAPLEAIDIRQRLGIPKDCVMGLAIMDVASCPQRKNPWEHVHAWKAAFANNPRRVLVLKLRVGKRTKVVLTELRELIGTDRNILILTDDLSGEEVAALHQAADIYLSLHRSEGFGLNILEALLAGKIVIATHWSANVEYGPDFPAYIGIPCELIRYHDWMGHYSDNNFKWADPIHELAVSALQQAAATVH